MHCISLSRVIQKMECQFEGNTHARGTFGETYIYPTNTNIYICMYVTRNYVYVARNYVYVARTCMPHVHVRASHRYMHVSCAVKHHVCC